MKANYLSITILAALALAACGKQGADPGNADSTLGRTDPASEPKAATAAPALPKPDLTRPLGEYAELKDGQQVMFHYVAASKLPPDYEKLAGAYSREYRQSNDAFRKNDLLQALKPQIDQGIAQATASPYTWIELDDADLQAYDFERKGFPVGEFIDDKYRYFNDASEYTYTWANRSQVDFAPVADEAVARAIEAARTKWSTRPRLRVYSMAQSADMNAQRVNAHVTRVQIVDRNGRVLAEYSPDGSVSATSEPETSTDPANAASIAADLLGG